MSATFTEVITLRQINCGSCGGTYAINERFYDHKRQHGETWHCPYCDCEWGFVESEASKLRKQLEAKGVELQSAQQREANERTARLAAEQRAAKEQRKAKRAENGVCTCCNRSFVDLKRHMASKHGVKNGEPAQPQKP